MNYHLIYSSNSEITELPIIKSKLVVNLQVAFAIVLIALGVFLFINSQIQ